MKERTITTDNFFTSLSLTSKLLLKKTTRGNKRELLKICKTKKDAIAYISNLPYRSNDYSYNYSYNLQKQAEEERFCIEFKNINPSELKKVTSTYLNLIIR